ncbi:hypothetical protein FSP39_014114 [Pinctada imbricata]|uniref:Uncharacterized protein n=1 Tax=Pinctada imbricata TaxID=66713 RepID=A0AA88YHF8_PINIB|nr:hypothetical protein FSP39_014114 [Pinctada imbricata]
MLTADGRTDGHRQSMSQLLGESLHVVQNLEQDPSNYLRTYNTTGCRNCQLYDEAITQFFGAMRVFSEKISQIKRVPAESSDQLHSENYSPELPDDVQTSSQNCGKNYSPEIPDDVQTSSQNGGKRTAFNGRTKEQLRSIRDKFGEFAKASKALLLTMFDKAELEGRSLRGKGPKGENARPAIADEGKLEVLYANINYQATGDNNTSLHSAAKNGNKKAVKYLLVQGADIEIRNAEEKRSFDLANEMNQVETADLLMKFRKFGAGFSDFVTTSVDSLTALSTSSESSASGSESSSPSPTDYYSGLSVDSEKTERSLIRRFHFGYK